jgi:hypothetical protein
MRYKGERSRLYLPFFPSHFSHTTVGENDPHIRVLAAFLGLDEINKGAKTARFNGLCQPKGEVQICRISVNRAIIGCIFPRNSQRRFYGFFAFLVRIGEGIGARAGLISISLISVMKQMCFLPDY